MKKTLLTLAIAIAGYCSYAQSTFPTDGSNVGIGTTSPMGQLDIYGGNGLRLSNGDPSSINTNIYMGGTPTIRWAKVLLYQFRILQDGLDRIYILP
jgi:hypothetical protein